MKHLDHVEQRLEEAARERSLPFVRSAARLLVLRAIRQAERAASTAL